MCSSRMGAAYPNSVYYVHRWNMKDKDKALVLLQAMKEVNSVHQANSYTVPPSVMMDKLISALIELVKN